ncbi:MAG TPA: hypothetical protein PKB02_02545 [Anaerohalosphaeraceae bacterium]|nr:hypothetical protein [Anaerohalosphaeraceae bacterium]
MKETKTVTYVNVPQKVMRSFYRQWRSDWKWTRHFNSMLARIQAYPLHRYVTKGREFIRQVYFNGRGK